MSSGILPLPSVVGAYRIDQRIGEGAVGSVYRATRQDGRPAAVKVVDLSNFPAPEEVERRLMRESNVGRLIRHPGIVEVLDVGVVDEKRRYLAMELLDGEDLDRVLANDPPPLLEYLGYLAEAVEAVASAHSVANLDGTPQPIVHRDLKPANLFRLRVPVSGTRIKVLDFGIARQLGTLGVTGAGTALGTLFYMPPEQIVDASRATPASDVWPFGVMIYEVIAGRRPFEGNNPAVTMVRITQGRPTPLRHIVPDCPLPLVQLVERCMALDPAARFGDARALAAELRACLSDPSVTRWAAARRTLDPSIRSDAAEHGSKQTLALGRASLPADRAERSPERAPGPVGHDARRAPEATPGNEDVPAGVGGGSRLLVGVALVAVVVLVAVAVLATAFGGGSN